DGTMPEIKKKPLSLTAINLLAMNVDMFNFDWIEPPEKAALDYALTELTYLGAVTSDRRLTDLGKFMSQLQIEPALARMVIFACQNGFGNFLWILLIAMQG